MVSVVLWAVLTLSPSAVVEDSALSAFLSACNATYDELASETRDNGIVRPMRAYTTKKVWYQVEPSLSILVKGGWLHSPESDLTSVSYTKDDIEVTFGPQGQRLSVFVERIPASIRSLRDRRTQFLERLDTADIGYAPLFGEGLANEVLFPAGESQKIYFVSGEYFDSSAYREPLKLSAFGRVNGQVAKLWEAELAPLTSGNEQVGTLAKYLRSRQWQLADVPSGAADDLALKTALAYRSENSGDGGVDLGFIGEDGHREQVRNVPPRGEMVSLAEERYLRHH